jgi:hypothetical protein
MRVGMALRRKMVCRLGLVLEEWEELGRGEEEECSMWEMGVSRGRKTERCCK